VESVDNHAPSTSAAPGRPCVVALMGLPGAGKSTIARALEQELGLRRVCRDQIRAAMFPCCDHSFIEKRAAFRAVLLAIEINGLLGASSVVDGMTFSRREDFERIAELAARCDFIALPLLVECPPALARERIARDLAAAAHPAADRIPALVDAVLARYEPTPASALRVDGTLPVADMCRLAVAEVAMRLSPVDAARKQ
jgi:predicted kinase